MKIDWKKLKPAMDAYNKDEPRDNSGKWTSGGSESGEKYDNEHNGAESKYKRGDIVRENRSGSTPEKILSVRGNMIETYEGNSYHHTKVVKHK